MANHKRNDGLTKTVQTIREMATTLLRNRRAKGISESQGLVKSRKNKHSQFLEVII